MLDNEKVMHELIAKVNDTHEMVKSMNKQRRWVNFFTVLKYIIFAGIAYSAYLAATPYIDTYNQTVDSINSLNAQVKGMGTTSDGTFADFLKKQFQNHQSMNSEANPNF